MLSRGERLTELLKQSQNTPYATEEQVVSIYMGTKGFLDDIEVRDVLRFEQEMLRTLRREKLEILQSINKTGDLSEKIEKELHDFLENFAKVFA